MSDSSLQRGVSYPPPRDRNPKHLSDQEIVADRASQARGCRECCVHSNLYPSSQNTPPFFFNARHCISTPNLPAHTTVVVVRPVVGTTLQHIEPHPHHGRQPDIDQRTREGRPPVSRPYRPFLAHTSPGISVSSSHSMQPDLRMISRNKRRRCSAEPDSRGLNGGSSYRPSYLYPSPFAQGAAHHLLPVQPQSYEEEVRRVSRARGYSAAPQSRPSIASGSTYRELPPLHVPPKWPYPQSSDVSQRILLPHPSESRTITGGSAFGKINLLADVATQEAEAQRRVSLSPLGTLLGWEADIRGPMQNP